MKTIYQVKEEINGDVEVFSTATQKRRIEKTFNFLRRYYKGKGYAVCDMGIGYFTVPSIGVECWICKA